MSEQPISMTLTESRVEGGRAFAATYQTTSLGGGAYAPVLICLSAGTGVTCRLTRIKYYLGTSKRVLIATGMTLSGGTGTTTAINRMLGLGQTALSTVFVPSTAITAKATPAQVLDDSTPAAGEYVFDRIQDPYILTGAKLAILISAGSGITASATVEWDER